MRSAQQKNTSSSFEKIIPWLCSILLIPVVLYFSFNIGKHTIIDIVNLLIHEGGHGVFRFFGKFIHALGGTLMQIIIPGMFVLFYFYRRNKVGTQIFLVWLGENLLNISVYASDAQAQQLPLLGGKKVFHDWNYLLRALGLLEYDYLVGQIFVILGISSFLVALLIPLLIREQKIINLDLDI
jgi:hypothetical protein